MELEQVTIREVDAGSSLPIALTAQSAVFQPTDGTGVGAIDGGSEVGTVPKRERELVRLEYENVPQDISLFALFKLFFLKFGIHAFGGPSVKLAMLHEHFVVQEKWITNNHWNRVIGVYQLLPGPEATEMCCFFGYLARGRLGSLVAGLGFMLPGFMLMLSMSALYVHVGVTNDSFNASLTAVQPVVAAMLIQALHKLGRAAVTKEIDHDKSDNAPTTSVKNTTTRVEFWLLYIAVAAAFYNVLKINFMITLTYSGFFYVFCKRRLWKVVACLQTAYLGVYIILVSLYGMPSTDFLGTGVCTTPTVGSLFLLGLMGGLLTFGGAYTAIPFLQTEVTVLGTWMTKQQFLDGLALANLIPAPLVIISTFLGYMGGTKLNLGGGGEILGALMTTIGMFTPAFSFTIIGHNLFERLVKWKALNNFLDGVTASVTGLIAGTALSLVRSSLEPRQPGIIIQHVTVARGLGAASTALAQAVNASENGGLWSLSTTNTLTKALAQTAHPLNAAMFILALYVLFNYKHELVNISLIAGAAFAGQYFYTDTRF